MTIKYSIVKGSPVTLTHDPDNKEVYTLIYRPEVWTTGKEVIEGDLIVIPTVPNGCMYLVAQGGVTGTVQPTWKTTSGSIIIDNNAKFKCLPYNLLLKTGDSITSFEFLPVTGITIDNSSLINGAIITFRISAVPTNTTTLTLTCRIQVTKANGILAQYDNSIVLNLLQS